MATCTAPGHDTCTITCPNGCGAIYTEPDGPCRTWCSKRDNVLKFDDKGKYSISINELPASSLEDLFGEALSLELRTMTRSSTKTINIHLTLATLLDINKAIQKSL